VPTEPCFEINPLVSFYQIRLQHSLEIFFRLHKASEEPVHSYEVKRKNSAHELFIEYEAKQCDKGQTKALNERLLFVPSHVVFTCNLFFTIQLSREIKSLDNSLFLVRKEPLSVSLPFIYAYLWLSLFERFCLQKFLQGPVLFWQVPAEVVARGCPREHSVPRTKFRVPTHELQMFGRRINVL